MAVLTTMGETEPGGVPETHRGPIKNLGGEGQGPEGLGAEPGGLQDLLEMAGHPIPHLFQAPFDPVHPDIPHEDMVAGGHLQLLETPHLPHQSLGGVLLHQGHHPLAGLPALFGHHVQGLPLGHGADGLMGLLYKRGEPLAEPVITPGVAIGGVHPLLDHGPVPQRSEYDNVVVELVSVLEGRIVHLGAHAAGIDQRSRVESPLLRRHLHLLGGLTGDPTLAPGHE